MIPLKDDIPSRRFPVATLALLCAGAVAALVVAGGPSAWVVLVSAAFVWLFGPSLEDAMGPTRYLLFLTAGAAAAAAIQPEAATAGSAAAVVGGYALLYPWAHVVTLGLVPALMGVFQLPALVVLATWPALQGLAAGPDPAPLAGLAVGLAAVRLLARDAQRDYRRPAGVAAY